MNVLLKNIANVCRDRTLDEKWLLAPSLRAGSQWADAVSRSGQPILNLRVKTFKSIVLDLAGPALAASGLKLLSPTAGEILADRAWRELTTGKNNKLRYFSDLQASRSLPRVLYNTLNALRMAGLGSSQLRPQKFDVREKAGDLSKLLDAYIALLRTEKRADYAQALELAREQVRSGGDTFSQTLLIPDDIADGLRFAERELLQAIPETQRIHLDVDEPATPHPDGAKSDAALLRWLPARGKANPFPKASQDGTLEIFRAAGEINEVREVLRRCIGRGIELDKVELLHTDNDAYLPLLYEEAERLGLWGEGADRTLPVTFAEGVPCRYSRPGRALTAWLSWIAADYPQASLVRMIQEGLLNVDGLSGDNFNRIADLLRPIRIVSGADRYKTLFAAHIKSLEWQPSDTDSCGAQSRRERSEATKKLRDVVLRLLEISPAFGAPASVVLDSALTFISTFARCVTEFDNNARNALRIEVSEMRELRSSTELFGGFDVEAWLAALPGRMRVGGSAPRPGCLHCAHVHSGGHSGRPHTFILGLNDGRFPGAGAQDPLLLDSERGRLSENLEKARDTMHARTAAFHRLLARLRGTVTLAYSCRDLTDERETFPSATILDAFRLLSNNPSAAQHDLEKALALPASFVPSGSAQCLDESDWWLWRLQESNAVADASDLVAQMFPHLGRGQKAAVQRALPAAGEFDGLVPEAGRDMNPLAADGPVMSASSLEQLGKCPLSYFFRYVLGIDTPDELELDPHRWLDALTSGNLLHDVFREYVGGMLGAKPVQDEAALMNLLERAIQSFVREIPAPSETVFQKEKKSLERAMRIFLSTGNLFKENIQPLFVEAAIGVRAAQPGTPLDSSEPVAIPLSQKESVRVCGRLDRIDRIGTEDSNRFAIVDYKTGAAKKYSREKPFQQGRVVQHLLYLEIARIVLQTKFPGAQLDAFSYFFAGERGSGECIDFRPEKLADGKTILRNLCRIAGSGAYLATENKADCKNCAYRPICHDVDSVTAASKCKLSHSPNVLLQPFRDLRQEGGTDETDSST